MNKKDINEAFACQAVVVQVSSEINSSIVLYIKITQALILSRTSTM